MRYVLKILTVCFKQLIIKTKKNHYGHLTNNIQSNVIWYKICFYNNNKRVDLPHKCVLYVKYVEWNVSWIWCIIMRPFIYFYVFFFLWKLFMCASARTSIDTFIILFIYGFCISIQFYFSLYILNTVWILPLIYSYLFILDS